MGAAERRDRMGAIIESLTRLTDTRRTETALALGGAQIAIGHAAGWQATIEIDGLTLRLSKLDGESEWIADAASQGARTLWDNGTAARYLRCKALTNAAAIAALDAEAAEGAL